MKITKRTITLAAGTMLAGLTVSLFSGSAFAQSVALEGTLPLQPSIPATKPALTSLQMAMKTRLAQLPAKTKSERVRAKQITDWYEARRFKPLWVKNGKPTAAAERITFMMIRAYEDGLTPSEYKAISLFEKLDAQSDSKLADFEVSMANAAVLYGQHLNSGRVVPNAINRSLVIYPDKISANGMLSQLAQGGRSATNLAAMAPGTERYSRLKKHLLSLRLVKGNGGWIQVPDGEIIREDGEDDRIAALRTRLEQSGDLPVGLHKGTKLDGKLLQALKYYQWRVGLKADGVVGPATLAQMNTTVDERIEQVELNLERRRWMQADFGKRYIFVNLADQVLKVVDNEKTVHATVVQVGKPYHATPVFTEKMEYLDFNPYWNVPYSIATKEYLPKLQQNPYALQRQNIRVLKGGKTLDPGSIPWSSYSRGNFPVRLRQDPGPKNALGRVKFMFPNKFNIYIHDTPSKSKFARTSRYFSHGCIRVRDPFKLAEVILATQGISRQRINGIAGSRDRKIVKLDKDLPVHIAYLTAWVNKDGSVHYRRDVYGRDKILAKALNNAS